MSTPYEQHPERFLTVHGVAFPDCTVRLVHPGDRYGRNGCLVHDQEEPLVEFYDGDYDFEPWLGIKGQFVSRYYVSTLLEHDSGGIDLYGGQPERQINAQEFSYVRQWLQARYP